MAHMELIVQQAQRDFSTGNLGGQVEFRAGGDCNLFRMLAIST